MGQCVQRNAQLVDCVEQCRKILGYELDECKVAVMVALSCGARLSIGMTLMTLIEDSVFIVLTDDVYICDTHYS